MMLSIQLYSTDPAAGAQRHIEPVVATIDFATAVEVSRTVGPANWFAIEKRNLSDDEIVAISPEEDISRAPYSEPAKIAALARAGSVLTVSYAFTKSERLGALAQAIATRVPQEAQGFFWSSAHFCFGPSDIVEFTEDEEGQDDVALVGVSHFEFAISCDDYRGRVSCLAASLDAVPEFASLRDDLQRIVGPLSLRLD